jgi:hypothetical protein
MRSITLAQAALFAALATVLLTAFSLVDDFTLIGNALFWLGSIIPSIFWAGFYFVVYRGSSVEKPAAWITLAAVILEALITYIRFQESVAYWTPFGNAMSFSGWALRLGWAVFLTSFALAPGNSRTRQLALALAIVVAPFTLSAAFGAFNSWIGLLVDDVPTQAVWRVLITPAIRTIFWLSQILFLWRAWGNPERRESAEASSARFAP